MSTFIAADKASDLATRTAETFGKGSPQHKIAVKLWSALDDRNHKIARLARLKYTVKDRAIGICDRDVDALVS